MSLRGRAPSWVSVVRIVIPFPIWMHITTLPLQWGSVLRSYLSTCGGVRTCCCCWTSCSIRSKRRKHEETSGMSGPSRRASSRAPRSVGHVAVDHGWVRSGRERRCKHIAKEDGGHDQLAAGARRSSQSRKLGGPVSRFADRVERGVRVADGCPEQSAQIRAHRALFRSGGARTHSLG